MQDKTKTYLLGLDALRFLAAISVVIFHFGKWSWPFNDGFLVSYINVANLGVSFFFVLSGFIMFYVYKNTAMDRAGIYNFLVARFTRIIPLYILTLLVSILYLYNFEQIDLSIKTILYHLFFIQSWIPGEVLTLNFVNWTLSIEMFFYLIFPFLFLSMKKSPRNFIFATILIWIVSNVATILLALNLDSSSVFNYELVKYFPLLHLNNFLVGMVGSYLYFNQKIDMRILQKVSYVFFALVLIYPLFIPEFMHIGHHNGLFAPIFLLVIFHILNPRNICSKILRLKFFTVLGKASYGVYLLQAPVYWFVYLFYKKLGVFETLGEEGRFYIFLIVLMAVSILSYYAFEKRVMVRLRNYLKITS